MIFDVLWICFIYISMLCFFFKQKTAYELRISDWSSDVCSSDRADVGDPAVALDIFGDDVRREAHQGDGKDQPDDQYARVLARRARDRQHIVEAHADVRDGDRPGGAGEALGGLQARMLVPRNLGRAVRLRSEEHTSELQSLMRTSYAVFCLKKKNYSKKHQT